MLGDKSFDGTEAAHVAALSACTTNMRSADAPTEADVGAYALHFVGEELREMEVTSNPRRKP